MERQTRASAFGSHGARSKKEFDGYERTSDYLRLPDGTRLAYDLLLPTRRSVPATRPLPVLFKYTPYLRTFTIFDEGGRNVIAALFRLAPRERALLRLRLLLAGEKGRYMDPVFRTRWLRNMLEHGYAVVVAERPGTGASFGTMDPSMETGGREAGQVIDWIAGQAWCDGNIGMFGDSFQAMIQFAAAAQGRKALKAIMPASSYMNGYEAIMYPGGIYNKAFGSFFKWAVDFMESDVITPVGGDEGTALLAQARAERAALGTRIVDGAVKFPYRDDLTKGGAAFWKDGGDLYPFLERINSCGVPAYLSVGWFDLFTEDMFLWFANLRVPRRLTVRPLDHSGADKSGRDLDYAAEALRWFDRWLKGLDNGAMDEAPLRYYEMQSGRGGGWREARAWPLPEAERLELFLAPASPTAAGRGGDGGSLEPEGPRNGRGPADEVLVDYSATTGPRSRWTAVNWRREYPDMAAKDAKGLAFSTAPLEADRVVCGEPIARIWLSTEAPDLDLFAYLEELDSRGRSRYVTEGELRLSHRKLAQAPYENFGLPFHSHFRSDLEGLPQGEPFLAELALLPTCYRFRKGSRIRLALAFADADNFETPIQDPPPRVRVHAEGPQPSSLSLPIAYNDILK